MSKADNGLVHDRIHGVARPIDLGIAEAEHPGLRAVARIQTAGFASSVGMQGACMLSRQADAAFKASPMSENLYRSILDAYGSVVVMEIQMLGVR